MRNETTPPPDLLPPQDVERKDQPVTPDLASKFPAQSPAEKPNPNDGTEFFPDDILDEDPELGGPAGVANEPSEKNPIESVPEEK